MTRTHTFPERLSSSSLSTINSCLPLGSENEPQWKWSRVARECASSWSCVAIFRFSGDFYLRLGKNTEKSGRKKAALRIISALWQFLWLRFDLFKNSEGNFKYVFQFKILNVTFYITVSNPMIQLVQQRCHMTPVGGTHFRALMSPSPLIWA